MPARVAGARRTCPAEGHLIAIRISWATEWFWLAFLINGPIVLTAHAIIITWLWHKSRHSMLAALLYHWSVTATAIIAPASMAEGPPGLFTAAIGAGVVWVVAMGLLVLRRADFA
jgi:hypothetical protein